MVQQITIEPPLLQSISPSAKNFSNFILPINVPANSPLIYMRVERWTNDSTLHGQWFIRYRDQGDVRAFERVMEIYPSSVPITYTA